MPIDKSQADVRIIVGAGGQGRVVLDVWRAEQPSATFCFLDDAKHLHGTTVIGADVVGPASRLADLRGAAVLAIGHNPIRLAIADAWKGRAWARVTHPTAAILASAAIGDGTVVFAGAVVGSGARVGRHVIVNSGAIVEHDCVIEDGVALGPGVCMGGRVTVGRGAFISAGATLAPRVTIGSGTVVGAGSVVTEDLPPDVLAFGVPARVVKSIDPSFDWGRLL